MADGIYPSGTWVDGIFAPGVWPFFTGLGFLADARIIRITPGREIVRVIPDDH
jgi:hypothetical protein